jgi:formate hydrogenlyase subunit 6/NADH:ubiquinone oxidoreductase subunit I
MENVLAYFRNILRGIRTSSKGLSLTLKHLWAARHSKGHMELRSSEFFQIDEGNVTLQYPHVRLEVPDTGRYQLDCEIDDCIVCDKCAKVCPVDCIEIEAIKSPELIRYASDGSPVRLHAAKFNIDMAKCCFCGLCTTVCPTECLTMTSEYDFSVEEVDLLNFAFSNLSAKEAEEKRGLYQQFVAEKEASKASDKPKVDESESLTKPKPVFKPQASEGGAKPAFVPKTKPGVAEGDNKASFVPKAKPQVAEGDSKPAFVPKAKPQVADEGSKSAFVPKAKPEVADDESKSSSETSKAIFVPKRKPPMAND